MRFACLRVYSAFDLHTKDKSSMRNLPNIGHQSVRNRLSWAATASAELLRSSHTCAYSPLLTLQSDTGDCEKNARPLK